MLDKSNTINVIGVRSRVLYYDGSECEYMLHHAFIKDCQLVKQGTKKTERLSISEIGKLDKHKYYEDISNFSYDVISGTYYGIVLDRSGACNVNSNLISLIKEYFVIENVKSLKAYLVLGKKFTDVIKDEKLSKLSINIRTRRDMKGNVKPIKDDGVFIEPNDKKETDILVVEVCGSNDTVMGTFRFKTNASLKLTNPDSDLYKKYMDIAIDKLPKTKAKQSEDTDEEE